MFFRFSYSRISFSKSFIWDFRDSIIALWMTLLGNVPSLHTFKDRSKSLSFDLVILYCFSFCGSRLSKFTWGKTGLFLLGVILISSILNPSENSIDSAHTKTSEQISNRPHFNKTIQKKPKTHLTPSDQKIFVTVVGEFINKFKSAKNEIQQSTLRDRRKESISNILQNRTIHNWEGAVSNLRTNSDGDAVLRVSLSKNITIKTWNNSLSDIGSNTMIKKGSNLYSKLWDLSEGYGLVEQ